MNDGQELSERLTSMIQKGVLPLEERLNHLNQEFIVQFEFSTKNCAALSEDLRKLQHDDRIASVPSIQSSVASLQAWQASNADLHQRLLATTAEVEAAKSMA